MDHNHTPAAAATTIQELVSCQAQGKGTIMLRESYEARLRTFSPLKYFAKPACLSPLVCARLGFCNVATNMLQCTACHAALEIDIPSSSSLSATARQSLTSQLEQQLEAAHETSCRFRHDAAYYFGGGTAVFAAHDENNGNEDSSSLVPMILAQVFRPTAMELLDPPKPQAVVRRRCKILFELLMNVDNNDDDDEPAVLDTMQIPKQLLEYGVQEEAGSEQSMLSRAAEVLFKHDNDENNKEIFQGKQLATKVLALAILGWSPIVNNKNGNDYVGDSSHNHCQCECPICWSRYSPPTTRSRTAESESAAAAAAVVVSPAPTKRARTAQPLDALQAHRHYCPFVCGFPRANNDDNNNNNKSKATVPLWQSLLQRLLPNGNVTATPATPSRVEIFEMLQSGVSHKKFEWPKIVESS